MASAVTARLTIGSLVAITVFGTVPVRSEPAHFRIDPEHLSITFFVSHLGYADLAGMFLQGEGSFVFDEQARTLSDLRVVVDTASVFTNHEARDRHLRSADFLDVEAYPEMVFVGREAEATSDTTGLIHGDLSLLGETRPLTLEATFNRGARYPFLDEHYAIGVDAEGTIKRSDFGMAYGVEQGWVGDEVRIVIGFEAIREEP